MTDANSLEVEREAIVTPASLIKPKRVRWLLHHRIPAASVTLLAGREGLGKSTIWARWVADVTHGTMEGDYLGAPGTVLVVANEDSQEHTLVPRLIAAGADLDRVLFLEIRETLLHVGSVNLPRDVERVATKIDETGARLVVIDPLVSVLDGRLDSHKDHSIRQALDPLNMLASRTGAAILGLVHLNKGQGSDVLDRVLGSRAFTAAARAVIAVAADQEAEDNVNRLLVFQSKNNLGPRSRDAEVIDIESVYIDTDDGHAQVGKAVTVGRREINPAEALRPADHDDLEELTDAQSWLLSFLMKEGGEALRADVIKQGQKQGFSHDQLKRAKKRLNIKGTRTSTFPSVAVWELPQSAQLARSEWSQGTQGCNAQTVHTHLEHQTLAKQTPALSAQIALSEADSK